MESISTTSARSSVAEPGYVQRSVENAAQFQRFIKAKVASKLESVLPLGNSPEVFTFQFTPPDQHRVFLARLVFYGGLEVFVSLIPEGVELPPHLPSILIEKGIHKLVPLGDQISEFNRRKV